MVEPIQHRSVSRALRCDARTEQKAKDRSRVDVHAVIGRLIMIVSMLLEIHLLESFRSETTFGINAI